MPNPNWLLESSFSEFFAKKYIRWGEIQIYTNFNFVLFYNSYINDKQYKRVLRTPFRLDHNEYCSTFTMNIASLLIHSINLFFLFASKYILICGFAVFWGKCFHISGVYFEITFQLQIKVIFNFQTQYFPYDIRSLCHLNWKVKCG